jgi:hypothetical protein
MLQQETERLRTDIDKMRNESKLVTILLCIDYGQSFDWFSSSYSLITEVIFPHTLDY